MNGKDANSRQIGGSHYKKMPIEHWDLSVLFDWDPFQYQITKYTMRWRDKNGIEDLEKVVHFAQKYLEVERARAADPEGFKVGILRGALRKAIAELSEPMAATEYDLATIKAREIPCAHLAEPEDNGEDPEADLRQSMRNENDRGYIQELPLTELDEDGLRALRSGGNLAGHARPTAAGRRVLKGE